MHFSLFCRLLHEELSPLLPSAADIVFAEAGGVRYITIRTSADMICPHISLEHFFFSFEHGCSLQEICRRILSIYTAETLHPLYLPEDIPDKKTFLHGLRIRPVSQKHYRRQASVLPHLSRYEMLFFYALQLPGVQDELGASLATNELIRHFRLSEEALLSVSLRNLCGSSPPIVFPLSGFLEKLSSSLSGENINVGISLDASLNESVFVITNEKAQYGAVSVLMPDVPEDLFSRFGEYYLLPSSVHEMLIIPRRSGQSAAALQSLLHSVNRSMDDSLLVLSDDLYAYSPEGGLHICR